MSVFLDYLFGNSEQCYAILLGIFNTRFIAMVAKYLAGGKHEHHCS
jgi:hypothetical protein